MSKEKVIEEIYRPARKNYPHRCFFMIGPNETFQSDLIEMQNFQEKNKGFRYILILIDVFTKYSHARPLRNKTGQETAAALDDVFKNIKKKPKNLMVDNGTEYYNTFVKKIMKKYKINMYSTYSPKKAFICERLIRTIKTLIYKDLNL